MTRSLLALALPVALSSCVACAPIPPPDVLGTIERVRASNSVRQAERDAPAAVALADKLGREARAAFERGDFAGAQLLGERAMAAFETAAAEARLVRAERVAVEVRQEAETADHALAKIEVEQQRVTADIAALESRIQVAEVTEPVAASEPATPERERARQEATRTVALQARLTCAAAALLARSATISPEAAADLGEAQQQLAAFASLAAQAAAAPIDGAMRVRARCLAALTAVRRALPAPAATTGEAADALLEALSEAGHGAPRRDERGVVLTLRGLFVGDALSAAGKKTLAEIASVAQRFARFPVMVLVHHEVEPAERDRTRSEARGAAVVAALEQVLGPGAIGAAHQLGAAEPLVDPRSSYRQRNERVEIVLVAPTTM